MSQLVDTPYQNKAQTRRQALEMIGQARKAADERRKSREEMQRKALQEETKARLETICEAVSHLEGLTVRTPEGQIDELEIRYIMNEEKGENSIEFLLKESGTCVRYYGVQREPQLGILWTEYGKVIRNIKEFVDDAERFVEKIVYA